MGRHKLYKTPEQVREQKRRWADNANRRRREKYSDDPEYRDRVKRTSRNQARKQSETAEEQFSVKSTICGLSLERLRKADPDVGITCAELAEMIGLGNVVTLYAWHRSGRFPAPGKSVVRAKGGSVRVYTHEQATGLVEIMFRHYSDKTYLFANDDETIALLYSVM